MSQIYQEMLSEFNRTFVNQGANSYVDFLNASLDKHAKEWTYLCYKSDQQASDYFFKKFEELRSSLQEKQEDLTPLLLIDQTPKIISLSEKNTEEGLLTKTHKEELSDIFKDGI